MASFPTAAITFATRSNGQTIDASHVNTLQDEVAAMESGYLDATARLNSSNSTIANLSVPGGSTFTGPATFSTVATFSTKIAPASTTVMIGDSTTAFKEVHCSSLYVAGVAFSISATYLRVSGSTSQYAAGSSGIVAWPTQDIISNSSLHSTGTNPERFTPQTTGVYVLTANLMLSTVTGTVSTGNLLAEIWDSSAGLVARQRVLIPEAGTGPAGGGGASVLVSGMKRFDDLAGSTQWLRITVTNGRGSTNSLHGTYSDALFFKVGV